GERVSVTWDNDGKKAEIRIKPGTRKVEVKKDGFTVVGEEVDVEDGGRRVVTAKLQRTAPEAPKPAVTDAWLKEVAALPAAKQVDAVAAKLKDLNPGFDGKVTHKIDDGVVTELGFVTDKVTDISPVQILSAVRRLDC